MTEMAVRPPGQTSAMAPLPHLVRSRVVETDDSVTLRLEPVGTPLEPPAPGQFMMLHAFGVGEIAISVCGLGRPGEILHTIRAVGAVSAALCAAEPGSTVGVRGPYGTTWGLDSAAGRDLVIVAGGVGLAPLRPVLTGALEHRDRYGRVILIAGARSQREFLYAAELAAWQQDPRLEMHQTVDVPIHGWVGETGLVTEPLRRLSLDPGQTVAFLCGPESMMRHSAMALIRKGVAAQDIRVSLERNMQCGLAWCGHCQLGPLLLCRDGPVVGYDVAAPLLDCREL
ncbi:MAG: FAD/NAD(P)-binding protein [Mycobacterium sp.]|nr:FAD/NAD(P)-binding protein [Mycobacterium sp.]